MTNKKVPIYKLFGKRWSLFFRNIYLKNMRYPQSLKLCSNEQLNTQTAKYPSAAGTKIRG